nr:MAG TPA: hypothetical protein [Caudoviricetes sp.]
MKSSLHSLHFIRDADAMCNRLYHINDKPVNMINS